MYIIETTPLRKSQYEAEWQAILADCEQRFNKENNYMYNLTDSWYDYPPYYIEAERIFWRRFGISVDTVLYDGKREYFMPVDIC